MVHLCRQSVALYVARFNEGGARSFTRSPLATWSHAVSYGRTTTRNQTTRLNHHPCGCRWGHFFLMKHTHVAILHPTNIWRFHVTRRDSQMVTSYSLVVDPSD
nr:hypothetical protein [Anoxybacillus amylolyticus]